MQQTEIFSFEEIIKNKFVRGDIFDGVIIGNIGKGTLIFNLEIYCNETLLEQLSWRTSLLKFHSNKSNDTSSFGLYQGGSCIRDNYSNDTFSEIGEPLEIETTATNKPEIIVSLINQTLDTNILDIENRKFYCYKKEKSFLSKLFN